VGNCFLRCPQAPLTPRRASAVSEPRSALGYEHAMALWQ
jgi:hypothetical protein